MKDKQNKSNETDNQNRSNSINLLKRKFKIIMVALLIFGYGDGIFPVV